MAEMAVPEYGDIVLEIKGRIGIIKVSHLHFITRHDTSRLTRRLVQPSQEPELFRREPHC
jgi:hypothetical protein